MDDGLHDVVGVVDDDRHAAVPVRPAVREALVVVDGDGVGEQLADMSRGFLDDAETLRASEYDSIPELPAGAAYGSGLES